MTVTIRSLHVYPVKGLKGIEVPRARCTALGLEHDRRFMVVDPGGVFFTQRTHPKMATLWTDFRGDALEISTVDMAPVEVPLHPRGKAGTRVTVWNSTVDAVAVSPDADAWLTEALGTPC